MRGREWTAGQTRSGSFAGLDDLRPGEAVRAQPHQSLTCGSAVNGYRPWLRPVRTVVAPCYRRRGMSANSVRTELDSGLPIVGAMNSSTPALLSRWHEPVTVEPLRLVSVMRAAPELDVFHSRLPAHTVGPHVMELEESSLTAPTPPSAQERAPRTVAKPDRPLHVGRDMPRSRRRPPRRQRPLFRRRPR